MRCNKIISFFLALQLYVFGLGTPAAAVSYYYEFDLSEATIERTVSVYSSYLDSFFTSFVETRTFSEGDSVLLQYDDVRGNISFLGDIARAETPSVISDCQLFVGPGGDCGQAKAVSDAIESFTGNAIEFRVSTFEYFDFYIDFNGADVPLPEYANGIEDFEGEISPEVGFDFATLNRNPESFFDPELFDPESPDFQLFTEREDGEEGYQVALIEPAGGNYSRSYPDINVSAFDDIPVGQHTAWFSPDSSGFSLAQDGSSFFRPGDPSTCTNVWNCRGNYAFESGLTISGLGPAEFLGDKLGADSLEETANVTNPEPATVALLLSGLLLGVFYKRRREQKLAIVPVRKSSHR